MTTLGALFLLYVAAVAGVLGAVLLRALPLRHALVAIVGLICWLSYAGLLGAFGIVGNATLRPPGIVILVLPVALFIAVVMGRSKAGGDLAVRVPLWLLVGLQSFRIGVEWFIQQLHDLALLPRLMTLDGGNLDLLIGISAPIVAWIATRRPVGRRIALWWSVVGIVSLLNIATRAVLTAPGPLQLIHAEVANRAMGTFPFTFIPGFLAPLAVALHVLALRAIVTGGREPSPSRAERGAVLQARKI